MISDKFLETGCVMARVISILMTVLILALLAIGFHVALRPRSADLVADPDTGLALFKLDE